MSYRNGILTCDPCADEGDPAVPAARALSITDDQGYPLEGEEAEGQDICERCVDVIVGAIQGHDNGQIWIPYYSDYALRMVFTGEGPRPHRLISY